MPELPDVELFKRVLDRAALGHRIAAVAVRDARILADTSPRTLSGTLRGARLEASYRHGKHLLAQIDRDGWLTLHFGMTGGLERFDETAPEPPHTRVRFDFAQGGALAYVNVRMLGRVGLADDAEAFIAAEGLGPDALDPGFDLAAFRAALEGRKRAVKAILMDQSVMAGIGNLYSDEILFQAGLSPTVRGDRLNGHEQALLFRKMKEVLETAIARRAGSERFLDRLPAGYLLPERHKGGRCPRCGRDLATLKAGGRTAYFCPACQPSRR